MYLFESPLGDTCDIRLLVALLAIVSSGNATYESLSAPVYSSLPAAPQTSMWRFGHQASWHQYEESSVRFFWLSTLTLNALSRGTKSQCFLNTTTINRTA
ncbi:hypothetical protein F5880DRAFT_1595311 [Lentinula raphanica]|nr:hypothetical protein F5880DRAFT_1595311 [Lentinula raphanica]